MCLVWFFCLWVCLFFFFGPIRHMKVPRLGVTLELQLLAHNTATATPDLSCVYDLHHSSQQHHRILNPLSRPGIEASSSWILVRFISAAPRWELHQLDSQPAGPQRERECVCVFLEHRCGRPLMDCLWLLSHCGRAE